MTTGIRSASFPKQDHADQERMVPSSTRQQKSNKKGLEHDCDKQSRRKRSAGFQHGEHPTLRENPNRQSTSYDMKVAYVPEARPSRDVTHKKEQGKTGIPTLQNGKKITHDTKRGNSTNNSARSKGPAQTCTKRGSSRTGSKKRLHPSPNRS